MPPNPLQVGGKDQVEFPSHANRMKIKKKIISMNGGSSTQEEINVTRERVLSKWKRIDTTQEELSQNGLQIMG